MKNLINLFMLYLAGFSCFLFAQIATNTNQPIPLPPVPVGGTKYEWLYFVFGIVLAVVEIIARLIPTEKNLSILTGIYKFVNAIISVIFPNRKDGGGRHD